MNEKILKALEKIALSKNLRKEISDGPEQKSQKLFELCQENSDASFTREEFEFTLAEIFVNFFENLSNSQKLSESDTEHVAGGFNFKKIAAASLASLSLMSVAPNFVPKASATGGIISEGYKAFSDMPNENKALVGVVAALLVPLLYKGFKWSASEFFKDIVSPAFSWVKNTLIYNRLELEKDPVKFRETMLPFLQQNVFAQDKAVRKVVNIMSGHIDAWNTQSEKSGACEMVFMGDSGTGKTLVARLLSQGLYGKDIEPWQYITTASVKALPPPSNAPQVNVFNSMYPGLSTKTSSSAEEENKNLSPADRLFNEESELVRQLTKNNRIIVVIDEIDKIHANDPNDTILERLRDAKDTGILRVRLNNGEYQDVNVSKTTFIFVTNELRECWGLPKKDLTDAEAAARTFVEHDKSLVNRFDVVEFENFKRDDYVVILEPLIKQLQQSYQEIYNMKIQISKNFLKSVGQDAENKNKGVRGLNDFILQLRGELVDCRSKNKIMQIDPKEKNEKPAWEAVLDYNETEDVIKIKTKKC